MAVSTSKLHITLLYTLWRGTITYYVLQGCLEPNLRIIMSIVPTPFLLASREQVLNITNKVMNQCPTGCCRMKRDLDNEDDPIGFLAQNHSFSKVLDELDTLSMEELQCATCLYASTLLKLSHKRTFWQKLKSIF